jgi:predicted naringenin-chalcone synthase
MQTHLIAIGTAVPKHTIEQAKVVSFMKNMLSLDEVESRRLAALYRATAIDKRYSVIADYGVATKEEFTFYSSNIDDDFPSVAKRMAIYKQEALPLAVKALENAFDKAKQIQPQHITHLITISCTGMYAPGIDIELVTYFQMRNSVQRTAINFMGCYGAFIGLKTADAICKSNPEAVVAMISVELCTLHFQKSKRDDDLLSASIFADGAAAVLFTSNKQLDNFSFSGTSLSLQQFYCDLLVEGKNEMCWGIGNYGFEMSLSSYIPSLVSKGVKTLIGGLKEKLGVNVENIGHYAIHPGGRAILETAEKILSITKEQNRFAYKTLKNYGNMSSATILFVLKLLLETIREKDENPYILSMAFGPGLTLETALLKIERK